MLTAFFLVASCACGTTKSHEPHSRPPSLSIAPSSSQSPTTASHSAMIASPISPTSPTIVSASSLTNGTSNRISKSQRSKKRNGIAGDGSRRRASFIGEDVALEILLEKERERSASAESVKMERAGSCCGGGGISSGNGHVNGHMSGHSAQGFVPVFSANIEHGVDQFHQQHQQFSHQLNARIAVGDTKPAPITNGASELKLDMDMSDMLSLDNWSSESQSPSWAQPQSTSKKMGVCCGNKPSQSSHIQQQNQLMQYVPSNPQIRPCCNAAGNNGSMKSALPVQQQPLAPYGVPQYFAPPQYPPPSYLSATNFQQPPPVWSYPVSTINHPLTPQELAWLQQQRAAGVFGQPAMVSPLVSGAQVDSWAHNCNCGSGCDCLGCATHPFNRRTVEYVKGIQQFMEGDHYSHSRHNHSRITFSQPLPQTQQEPGFGNNNQMSTPLVHPTQPPSTAADTFSNVTTSPAAEPAPTTPPATTNSCCNTQEEHQSSPTPSQDGESGSPGGTDNSGALSPSGFFYVDYPFGTCAQTETGCKCGEGCTCVGCLTHGGHDGVGLEANIEENGQWGW